MEALGLLGKMIKAPCWMEWTCASAAISSPSRIYKLKQLSMPCTMCLIALHAAGILADRCSSPDTVVGILLALTFGCLSTNVTWYYKFWILLNIAIIPILLNIAQYYWYYSMLHASHPGYYSWSYLGYSWSHSGYCSVLPLPSITQYYRYYAILVTHLNNNNGVNITDITRCYWYYSIWHANVILKWFWSHPGYYSVSPILLNTTLLLILPTITFRIFINVTQDSIFHITQYYISQI